MFRHCIGLLRQQVDVVNAGVVTSRCNIDVRRLDVSSNGGLDHRYCWANTLAHILGLELSNNGQLRGRVMTEALADGGAPPESREIIVRSEPADNGFITVLNAQEDAA